MVGQKDRFEFTSLSKVGGDPGVPFVGKNRD